MPFFYIRFCKFLFCLLLVFLFPKLALAKLEISIHNDFSRRTKILVAGLENNDFLIRGEVNFFRQKLLKNLDSTGLFEFISYSDFKESGFNSTSNSSLTNQSESRISKPSQFNLKRELAIGETPDFEIFEKAGIDNIAIFAISANMVGNIEIHLKIWDVNEHKQLISKSLISLRSNLGDAAKNFANQVYVALTGEERGHFISQIAYVAETGSIKNRIKKLCLIEIDGDNRRCITDGSDLVLTPVFSKKSGELFYVRYFQGRPQVFVIDIASKQTRKIGGYRQTTLSPAVHPFYLGTLLLTVIDDGNSDIHLLDIANNSARRLTKSPSIETSASFSPDGKLIIFTSDRENGQQIFRMNQEGGALERVSKSEGTYANPKFSPDGKFISFTKIFKNKFSIGIMNANGRNEKILTSAYLVEGARWSANSRYLIYSKKTAPYGKDSMPKLFIIDVLTGFEYQIPTPENEGATDPDWSYNG